MHALVGTDGSKLSIAAARRGCDLVGADHVTLLTVVDEWMPDDDAGGIEGPVLSPEEQEEMRKRDLEVARAGLARTASALTGMQAQVEEKIEGGDPADVICDVAEHLGVDVVIVGSHGRTGLGRLFLGSVSEHVVRHASCPVLVVRGAHAEHEAD